MHETFFPDTSKDHAAEALLSPDAGHPDAELCVDELAGELDRNRLRNLFQGGAVLLFIVVGAVLGEVFLPEAPFGIRAIVGAVPGMIVGTFVSGFVLMIVPAPPPMISRSDYLKKYCRLRRIEPVLFIASIASCLTMPLVIVLVCGGDGGVLAAGLGILWFVTGPRARLPFQRLQSASSVGMPELWQSVRFQRRVREAAVSVPAL